jgi:hypothetical protein
LVRPLGLEDLLLRLLRCLGDQFVQFATADLLGSGSEDAALQTFDLVLEVQADLLEVLDLGGGFQDFCFGLGRLGLGLPDLSLSLDPLASA